MEVHWILAGLPFGNAMPSHGGASFVLPAWLSRVRSSQVLAALHILFVGACIVPLSRGVASCPQKKGNAQVCSNVFFRRLPTSLATNPCLLDFCAFECARMRMECTSHRCVSWLGCVTGFLLRPHAVAIFAIL